MNGDFRTYGNLKIQKMKIYRVPFLEKTEQWQVFPALTDFSFPWRAGSPPHTSFRAYHDKEFLFYQFEAMGTNPKVYVKNNHKMEVLPSERVEIFFRQDSKMEVYYCLEMDALGRVLDYQGGFYRLFNYEWNWPEPLFIRTEITEDRYFLSGSLKLTNLAEMGLLKNNKLEVGLFRAYCTALEGDKATLEWISWVNPETREPDFHVPEAFGLFVLE
jgi:hypothetical protein